MRPLFGVEVASQDHQAALVAAQQHRLWRTAREADRDRQEAERLRALLRDIEGLPLDDGPAWEAVRGRAVAQTERLARSGRLPSHLTVSRQDPPVLLARTLVVAWRRLHATPPDGASPYGAHSA